jgi:hypothetical protein
VGHTIRNDASQIAADTLPGLVDAGAAMAMTQENWLRVHQVLTAPSSAERDELVRQVRANSTDGLWRDYGVSIFEAEDSRNYREMLTVRSNYFELREAFFDQVKAGRMPEAKAFLGEKLTPAYERYRAISKDLFEYNARQGRERAAKVIHVARRAPFIIAFAGLVIFGFGVLIGLRGAFSGLDLVFQRGKNR